MANLSQIKLPNGTVYNLKDNGALQLTGGSVTGPVSFGDSVSIDEATVGDLVVNGSASFTNNLQANTINGVEVGSNPKFTDTNTVTTATTTGSGNAVTAITASNGALTITKGTTFLTAHNTYTISNSGSGNAVTGVSLSGTTFTVTKGSTFLTSHQDISGKADKATTLAGYGITDAKIASGVITLGSNTITPLTSSSTLSAAKLSGAIPSAVTATTQASTDNSTKIATTAYVTTAIANLPEPMIFKGSVGTGGTVTSLPTAAASNEGWTYKVITALSSPAAKVGDTVISNGSSWVVIPSGDEPSGTVTSVGVSNATNGGLTVSGSPVTSSGTITIGHSNVLSSAQTTQAVYPIKIDKNGHISAYGSAVTIPTKTSQLTNDSGFITNAGVTGVKGNAESSYRTGQVNLTPANLGAVRGNSYLFYGTCDTAAATAEKAVTCNDFTSNDLQPGAVINVYFTVTNSAAVANLQLNVNGTGAKSIRYIYNGSYSNIPGAGYIKLNQVYQFTYDGTYWIVQMIYNTNSDTTYCLYYSTPKAGPGGIFPYTLILPLPDGRYSSIVTSSSTGTSKSRNTSGFLPGMVFYYPVNRTLTEDTTNSNDYLKESSSLIDLRYSCNKGTTLTAKTSVYLVGSIGADGLFYLDSDWITQTIPTSANGKVYLFLGEAYDTYRIDLDAYNPMFKYTNGVFRQISIDAITTNGHTVNSDVPANAKFTDTVPTTTQSKVTGITASTTATKTTLGTAFTIPNVTSAGSASTWAFEEISIPNVTSAGSASTWAFEEVSIPNVTAAGSASTWTFGATTVGDGTLVGTVDRSDTSMLVITAGTKSVQQKTGGGNGTAPTIGTAIKVQSKKSGANGSAPTLGTAIKVQSKKSGANGSAPTLGTAFTVPNVTGNTSATVSITDPGHTHSI